MRRKAKRPCCVDRKRTISIGKPSKHLIVREQVLIIESQEDLIERVLLCSSRVRLGYSYRGVRSSRFLSSRLIAEVTSFSFSTRNCKTKIVLLILVFPLMFC